MTKSAEETVGDGVAFDVVGFADLHALHECENPGDVAAVGADPEETVVVDALVGCQGRVADAGLRFAEDEAGAERSFETW